MRALARCEDASEAQQLADVLDGSGVAVEASEAREGGFVVWVANETDVAQAREIVTSYRAAPDDPRFEEAARQARAKRRERARAAERTRHRQVDQVDIRKRWTASARVGLGRVTLVLIGISIGVAVWTKLGDNGVVIDYLAIASLRSGGFTDILRGEVWRLVTPIFVHLNILHILFNMMWLADLGSRVERARASWFLVLFVVLVAIASNLTQYVAYGNPMFGGMSGVVYALLGYAWMRGRLDPASGLTVAQPTMVFMLVWLALGFVGAFNMANGAHAGGLVAGVLWGSAEALGRPGRRAKH